MNKIRVNSLIIHFKAHPLARRFLTRMVSNHIPKCTLYAGITTTAAAAAQKNITSAHRVNKREKTEKADQNWK